MSKERNVPRLKKSESTEDTIRVKKREPVTPAPGGKLNDRTLDTNRRSSVKNRFLKASNQTLIQQSVERAKKIPGVGHYNTTDSFKKVSMTASL